MPGNTARSRRRSSRHFLPQILQGTSVPRQRAAGQIPRAVVFVLVGVFLLKAAVLSSAKQAKGLDAVFRSVASSAYGPWLLAGLASGLVCYGLYCLLEARYRDLTPGR